MTYANLQAYIDEVNSNIGFELYALKYQGKGRAVVLYEYNKIIARGKYAVEREVLDLHKSFCGGKL